MTIFDEILNDKQNEIYTHAGLFPIYSTPATASILIIGQAPSKKVQDSGVMWNDASGDRLREWLGITKDTFYNSGKIAVIPMDFYYPGKAKSGDKPPRKGIAEKWHTRLIQQMPNIKLTILIGAYAQRYYLSLPKEMTITATVQNYQAYLPNYFPIVHPSPRNNIWLKKNLWFGERVIPALQQKVARILN
ncbi:uracil-DNA glycosylase family protein [Ligilactobacillus sp. WILCCON 0076]|uniref:Uracil-DNA glycosylase family protein n=1 Tax=Ligilactobacillus ubinensis TaxID=2876789 RepID=A0A9X2JMH9_9LACO|nr:uracil-DNA glycosylase family protein [Ligilactobacillus ubinensis]MCP0888058.1 uracil-DNA glycosylase family protein [Ligilactobacillus ubinensis]